MGTLNIWVGQLLGWKDIIFYTQLPCWLTQLVVYPNCLALDFPCPIFSEMCCAHEFEINAYNDISPKRMKLFFFNNLNIVFVLLHINCVACMFYISFNFVFIYDLLNVPTFFELLLYSFVWNYNEIYCKSAYQRLVQRLGSLQTSEGGVQCESESSILLLQWFCIWRWSPTSLISWRRFPLQTGVWNLDLSEGNQTNNFSHEVISDCVSVCHLCLWLAYRADCLSDRPTILDMGWVWHNGVHPWFWSFLDGNGHFTFRCIFTLQQAHATGKHTLRATTSISKSKRKTYYVHILADTRTNPFTSKNLGYIFRTSVVISGLWTSWGRCWNVSLILLRITESSLECRSNDMASLTASPSACCSAVKLLLRQGPPFKAPWGLFSDLFVTFLCTVFRRHAR